jgi:hypothetical protein
MSDVGKEQGPAVVAPESFQTHPRFVIRTAPELARALEPATTRKASPNSSTDQKIRFGGLAQAGRWLAGFRAHELMRIAWPMIMPDWVEAD